MLQFAYILFLSLCSLFFQINTALSAAPYYLTTDNLKYAGMDIDWQNSPSFITTDTVYLYSEPNENSKIYTKVPPDKQLSLKQTCAYLYLYNSELKLPQNPPPSYFLSTNMPKKGDSVNLIYNNPQDDISIIYHNGCFMTFPAVKNKFQRNAEIWFYLQSSEYYGWTKLNENKLKPLNPSISYTINADSRFYDKYLLDTYSNNWYWLYSDSENTVHINTENLYYTPQQDAAEIYIENSFYSERKTVYSRYIISFKNNTITKTDFAYAPDVPHYDIFGNHPDKEKLNKYFTETKAVTYTPNPNSIDTVIMEKTADLVDRQGKLAALTKK